MNSMHWFTSFVETNDNDPFSSNSHVPQSSPPLQSSSSSSSLFCSAEQLFTMSSPWPHAPWKMMPSLSSSSSSFPFPVNNHFTNNHQQPSSSASTSSSSSSLRRKQQRQQPDSSSGSESLRRGRHRHRHSRPPLHCRSRSDATAMTEASSSEDYYDSNNNNSNIHSDSSNLASTAYVTGSELERAMWLVGMNNAAAHQYYNSQQSSNLHYNCDALADVDALAAAEAAVERAQRSLLLDTAAEPLLDQCLVGSSDIDDITTTTTPPAPLFVETSLSGSLLQEPCTSTIMMPDVGTPPRRGGRDATNSVVSTSSAISTAAMEDGNNVFDLCSPSSLQRYQKRNNVTPVYHRYRHVGEFGNKLHGDSSSSSLNTSPSAKVKYPNTSSSTSTVMNRKNSSRQDSQFLLARSHQSAPILVGNTTASSPTSVLPPASPSSKPLSKYKQHILKKHSCLESQKEAATDNDTVTNNQNSVLLVDRPPKISRRSKSTPPPILATVDGISSIHDQHHNADTTAMATTPTSTTSATARAMVRLAAVRRARTQSHDATIDGGVLATTTATTVTTSNRAATPRELLSEIVSPSNNTMVAGLQYIDSDDLLAVVKNDSMCSVESTPSTTPTVRAGTFNSAADRKTTTSTTATTPLLTTITSGAAAATSRHRRVLSSPLLSPIGQPTLDDCDTSSMATPPTGAPASNPVSIDECGPIDVDTGEEVDALIDSISIVSPLYDSPESRLSKQDLLECLQEEQRFRGLEFPILDEVDITRGLASYMPGFEPNVEDVNSLALQQQQQRTGQADVDISAWLDVEIKNRAAREMDKYHHHHHDGEGLSRRRPSCMMSAFKPKILSSLMCAVVTPQYQLHHGNHSIQGSDCQQQQQHHPTRPGQRGGGGRTVFSVSTSTGSVLRSLGQDSRLTFEI